MPIGRDLAAPAGFCSEHSQRAVILSPRESLNGSRVFPGAKEVSTWATGTGVPTAPTFEDSWTRSRRPRTTRTLARGATTAKALTSYLEVEAKKRCAEVFAAAAAVSSRCF
jgi:hypothetical protein